MNGDDINCGKGIIVHVDVARFNDEVNNYVFRYGLRQMLSDVHAAVKKDEADCRAKSLALINKKLEALYAGDFRAGSESRLDPVEAEARRLALVAIQTKLKAKGRKRNTFSTDWFKAAVDKNWPLFQKKAAAIVKIRDAEKDVVDLADIEV